MASSPTTEDPCSSAVALPPDAYAAVGKVSWAITMPEPLGPSEGDIQNTAPSVVLNAAVSVQSHKPRLGEVVIALVSEPSVIPTVSHESNSASALKANNAGSTPPTSAPNGVPA